MIAQNTVIAQFEQYPYTVTGPLPQWSYGQTLVIRGLDLPRQFEVYFSNSRQESGTAVPVVGTPEGTDIPAVLLESGKPVYAFLLLHASDGDGAMRYRIEIPVAERPKPSDYVPDEEERTLAGELLRALNDGVERAERAAMAAEADRYAVQSAPLRMAFVSMALNAAGELIVNNSERLGSTAFALTAGGNLEVNI